MTDVEIMTRAYIEALYSTDTGDNDQPESTAELTPLCLAKAFIDCRNFHRALTRELPIAPPVFDWAQVGHDLWLTRNGHGTGFWDRPEVYGEDLCLWLTAMATAMGEHDADFVEGV